MKKRLIAFLLCVAVVLGCCVFGAAAETMTDAEKQAVLQQRRDIAEAHMRKICSFMWRCEEDVHYNRVPSTLPEDAEKSLHLVAGRLYRGLPYSYSGGSYETFQMLASEPDENGVHTVSGLNWQMLSGGSSNGRFGTDCSGSVCQSWSQIGNSFTFQVTAKMAPDYGFLRVGDYVSGNGVVNDDFFVQNTEQQMYTAYAQAQKADALVHDGHVRMVVSVNTVYNEDETINGEESTITILEQTTTWFNKEDCYYDETLGETVYNICGVDIVYTFKQLFDYCYVPITCKELIDPSTVEAPLVTDSLAKEDYGYETLLEGEITSNNWTIDYLQMTISDKAGNTVQQGTLAALRSSSSGNSRYKVLMRQFELEYREKMLGYIAPDALAAGQYHCKLVCRLSNGMEFAVRDFDFTVDKTKNDVHKTVIDFTQGTVHDCPMCGAEKAQWQPLTADYSGSGNGPAAGHYYLTESLDNTTYTAISGVTVCLHLNNCNITSTERAFWVGNSGTLNIMGEGIVTGTYTSTAARGVAMDVTEGNVNLYGGTYKHSKGTNPRPIIGLRDTSKLKMYEGATIVGNPNVSFASVIVRKGRFEMYGGVVEDGYGGNGGNFLIGYTQDYSPAYLVVYGGTIRNGHSSGSVGGGNIYAVYDSYVFIRGGEIYGGEAQQSGGNIALHKSANAIITGGTVTGGTAGTLGNNIYANNQADTKLGICLRDAGVRIGGDARVVGDIEYNGEKNAFVKIENGTSLVKDGLTAARYPTIMEALEAYAGYDYLRLHDSQPLALSTGTWKADLNGQSVVLTGQGTLEVSADGGATFDTLDMRLTHVNLRPENVGIYYTGAWNLGAGLQDKVATSGIAASLVKMPDAGFAENSTVLYTEQAGVTAANSALIAGIFEEGATNNRSRGKRPIYAAPYVMFADGSTVVRGDAPAYSLYDILKQVDESGNADALQKADAFCKDWYSVIKPWGFVNIGNG